MYDIDIFSAICDKAHESGIAAVDVLEVKPMIVGQETALFSGEIDYTKKTYYVSDGVCGFAWVDIYPQHKGNTRLGKEERKVLESCNFRKNDYTKTYQMWVSSFNQSMQKKEVYARAFAEVLRDNGIKAYSGYRLD